MECKRGKLGRAVLVFKGGSGREGPKSTSPEDRFKLEKRRLLVAGRVGEGRNCGERRWSIARGEGSDARRPPAPLPKIDQWRTLRLETDRRQEGPVSIAPGETHRRTNPRCRPPVGARRRGPPGVVFSLLTRTAGRG